MSRAPSDAEIARLIREAANALPNDVRPIFDRVLAELKRAQAAEAGWVLWVLARMKEMENKGT